MKTDYIKGGSIDNVIGVQVAENCIGIGVSKGDDVLIPYCSAWDFLDTAYPLVTKGLFGQAKPKGVPHPTALRLEQVTLVDVKFGANHDYFHIRHLLIRDRFGNGIQWELFCEGLVDGTGAVIPTVPPEPDLRDFYAD